MLSYICIIMYTTVLSVLTVLYDRDTSISLLLVNLVVRQRQNGLCFASANENRLNDCICEQKGNGIWVSDT